jgi:outer membrane receptor protein involved in Fe transport
MYIERAAGLLAILFWTSPGFADDPPDATPGDPGAAPVNVEPGTAHPAVESGTAAPAVEPGAATPSADAAAGEVIVVEGRGPEPAELRLPAAQLREVPGSLGDPVRAVTALPGIVPTEPNRPDVYIRGAPPANTVYLLDGIRVPLLYHSGVVSSVVSPALVDTVGFFASAPPARYGGLAGGAIEVETAAPAKRLRAALTVKAYEAGALVESPMADGRGSVLGAVRVGYPQLVTAITASDVELAYWDYQIRTSWALGDHDRIGVLAFGSHDRLGENEDGPDMPTTYVEELASDFHRVDLRYDHARGGSRLRVALTGGWGAQGAEAISVDHLMYGARIEGEARLGATLRGRAGLQFQRDLYRLPAAASGAENPAADSPANAAPSPRNANVGGYADVVWDARDDLRITPGVRFDVHASKRSVDGASGSVPVVEPRLGLRWRIRPELSLVAAAGLAHQYPLLRVGDAPATAVTVPGFWADERHLQSARQASAGVEGLLPGAFTAIATGFGSRTRDLTDLERTCDAIFMMMPGQGPAEPLRDCGDVRSTGVAYGVELSLRRPLTERLAGWLSYTLSRATTRYTDEMGTHTRPSVFDRTHVGSASVAFQISAGWRSGARVVAYSGAALRLPASVDGAVPARDLRQPWFYRLDLRGERRWNLAQGRTISLVFDLLNATLSRERFQFVCRDDPAGICTGNRSLFVVPSIGVEASF